MGKDVIFCAAGVPVIAHGCTKPGLNFHRLRQLQSSQRSARNS